MPAGQSPSAASARADRMHAREHVGEKMLVKLTACVRAIGRRLTQIRGRVKKPLMLGQGETVGHPGDEIADPAGTLALALALPALDAIRAADRPAICW